MKRFFSVIIAFSIIISVPCSTALAENKNNNLTNDKVDFNIAAEYKPGENASVYRAPSGNLNTTPYTLIIFPPPSINDKIFMEPLPEINDKIELIPPGVERNK